VQVGITHCRVVNYGHVLTFLIGSGCIAALEAEKWLAEQEEGNPLDHEKEARKSQASSVVPEYRHNPLL
jgi:hypothetical protein